MCLVLQRSLELLFVDAIMKDLTLLAVASLSLLSHAAPTENARHVLHEKRNTTPRRWQRGVRVHPDAILPLKIGLTQSNLDDGYDLLMQVSHPTSSGYGKHWSAEEVHDFFAPAEEVYCVPSIQSKKTDDR